MSPTSRQKMVANFARLYPFYSGCGSFANNPILQRIAGITSEKVWSPVPGGEVLAPLGDYVGRAAFYVGDLDRKVTWICSHIVRPGDTVLDIGANIGMVTLWLSKLVGDDGKVYAFEPNPELQKILNEMLVHNSLHNVYLQPMALGAEQGLLELRIPRHNLGAASLIRNRDSSDCDAVEVPVRTLSRIVAEEGIESIRLIKIDVEGFEAEVFRGGQDVLASMPPEAILFELNEKLEGTVRTQPVFKILFDFGYEFFAIPKCFVKMRLERFDIETATKLVGNDFLAVHKSASFNNIIKL